MGRPVGAKNRGPESFFDRGWWSGAAQHLNALFPEAVKVTLREPTQQEKKTSCALLVESWEVDYLFLCKMAGGPCHVFEPGRVIENKKIVLMYCLYHQRMTDQAFRIADESDRLFAGLAALEELAEIA